MTGDGRDVVRRYWRRYAFAVLVPVVAGVGVAVGQSLLYEQARGHLGVAIVGGAFLLAAAGLLTFANDAKPHAWPKNAAAFGLLAGTLAALSATGVPYSETTPLPAFGVFVLWLAGCAVAWHAKLRATEKLGTTEVVSSDIGVRFDARANNAWLEVDTMSVQIHRTDLRYRRRTRIRLKFLLASLRLDEITSADVEYYRHTKTVRQPGTKRLKLTLTPGQVLHIGTADGDWLFPTNNAYAACEIIEKRRKKYGQPTLGPFLPGGS
jgi:hypothetical protein